MPTFTAPDLTDRATRVFRALGAPPAVATRVAQALVDSNLVGHDSHGVIRIQQYIQDVHEGRVVPDATPTVTHATPAIAVVDGGWAFGQVAASFALEQAMSRAHTLGLGAAGLKRAWHVGRLGEYCETAAGQGLVTHILCNTVVARVVPFGGREGRFGTNPLAWGIPVPGHAPFILDFATSVVAEGKIRLSYTAGKPIPEGWVIDGEGRSTTSSAALYEGGYQLPFGGYKGSGLAMVVDIVGSLLVGMGAPALPDTPAGNGMLIIAVDPAAFGEGDWFATQAAALLDRVKDTPPAPGFDEVMLPGEPEARTRAERLAHGIPIEDKAWAAIVAAAQTVGVDLTQASDTPQ